MQLSTAILAGRLFCPNHSLPRLSLQLGCLVRQHTLACVPACSGCAVLLALHTDHFCQCCYELCVLWLNLKRHERYKVFCRC